MSAMFAEEEPPVGPFPEVTDLRFTTADFMVIQPCTENLNVRFQAALSDPDGDLAAVEYAVTHVADGLSFSMEIHEDKWGPAPWVYTISNNTLKDNIANPIPGGKYDITVAATDTERNYATSTISFFVKYELSSLENTWVVESEDSQIKVVEGKCVVGEGDPATIGATIFWTLRSPLGFILSRHPTLVLLRTCLRTDKWLLKKYSWQIQQLQKTWK